MATVAINGLERIGRATLKVLTGLDGIRIAAINDELFTACSPGADVDICRRSGRIIFTNLSCVSTSPWLARGP
jgi:hypothetical protein